MSDELNDAYVDYLAEHADEHPEWGVANQTLKALAVEVRARRAQDTPSDPAAWLIGDVEATTDAAYAERQRGLFTVVPLYRDREPGAVAAAPTEERCGICGGSGEYPPPYAGGRCDECGGRGVVPLAPSAGEDEAAVERAARAAYAAFDGQEMPAHSVRLGHWRSIARAALAAARGPRMQDDT